jgi:hypothetical protein
MNSRLQISGACRLDDWGVIRARGADAGKFLQGQLTNDVLGLGPARACLAGFCSAKGRLQASFVVCRPSEDEFLLACPAGLLAATLKRLSMFVLRAQCKLDDASGELLLWGVAGAAAKALAVADPAIWEARKEEATIVIRLPDGAEQRRCLVIAQTGFDVTSHAGAAISLDTWHWLQVQSGVVTIEPATVDRFVPQMVNFERVGGVDFQKGCYPGQEVVARSQYRGTTKRRTFLFDCDAAPSPGQDVFALHSPLEPAGTVANAAPRPDGHGYSALVELRLAALSDDGGLRLGGVDGAELHRAALPYSLPLEAEAAA